MCVFRLARLRWRLCSCLVLALLFGEALMAQTERQSELSLTSRAMAPNAGGIDLFGVRYRSGDWEYSFTTGEYSALFLNYCSDLNSSGGDSWLRSHVSFGLGVLYAPAISIGVGTRLPVGPFALRVDNYIYVLVHKSGVVWPQLLTLGASYSW